MPTTAELRSRLVKKLQELFQLDQPDLDFGFYRIMHAKAEQITNFLENDLLAIVGREFGGVAESNVQSALRQAERRVQESLGADVLYDDGSLNPIFANTPAGQAYLEAKVAAAQAADTLSAEAQVYDHLNRFFERYYEDGDFISRRYYQRENAERAAAYAIPYQGEEVKLVWANMDQYYIKTTEHFSNFTFDLSKAREFQANGAGQNHQPDLFGGEAQPQSARVHFQVVSATEGEHGNVKASEQTTRFFMIHDEDPIGFNEQGELICRFEFRPDPDKTGQENTWRERRNSEAVKIILDTLRAMSAEDSRASRYDELLSTPAPTEKEKNRPLLARYVYQYTARNSRDYFIHKDLGSFLRRELDFYIKNEVMRLDDIENVDASKVESYLAQIKVLRQIAGAVITFLAQLEDFQKKLWLKKKFVVETNYCITLDRVPEEFNAEIAANNAQREEWVRLFAIDEITQSTIAPGYSVPLTVEFLQANDKLVLDTRFFDADFTARLLATIPDLDEQCDGLLIHSENFQALNLLQERYREQVKCTYIDPPYNTGEDGFPYRDCLQHSSWLSMMDNRLLSARNLHDPLGVTLISIGREELFHLQMLCTQIFGAENRVGDLIWEKGRKNDAKYFSLGHDYILVYARALNNLKANNVVWREAKPGAAEILAVYRRLVDEHLDDYAAIQRGIREYYSKLKKADPKHPALKHVRYNRVDSNGLWRDDNMSWPNPGGPTYDVPHPITCKPCKVPPNGWRFSTLERFQLYLQHGFIEFRDDHTETPFLKRYLNYVDTSFDPDAKAKHNVQSSDDGEEDVNVQVMPSVFYKNQQPTVKELAHILGAKSFDNPKDPGILSRLIGYVAGGNATILDYFAGSGTTGHAVINMNRENLGNRKYILVEMGDYFDTVLKPRIAKVVYADTWRDGKPANRDTGISHCFKYLRLESYEDALNNLQLVQNDERDAALAAAPGLRHDYLLRYMLDVETRGSQSLLNIDAFVDPTAYKLKVKRPGSDEYVEKPVDLIETFNYLLGLRVEHIAAPQRFTATFTRPVDPELPQDQRTRLQIDGRFRRDDAGAWWFRKVEGWLPRDPSQPDSERERVLIVWRTLTGDLEQDNLMLDEWFRANRINTRDWEFNTIYVNGSNNLPNLRQDDETWKVRLIEEEFMRRMWDVEDV